MIELGDKVKDKITGFTGIAVCSVEFFNNCTRYSVQPQELGKEGEVRCKEHFDITQLEVIEKQVVTPEPPVAHSFAFLDEVEDELTGFKGKVISIACWLSGCIRIGVQGKDFKDGRPVDDFVIPVQQLKLIDKAKKEVKTRTGGPMKAPQEVRMPN